MADPIKLGVVVGSEIARPSDRPVVGDQRLVRMLPAGLPGTQGKLFPAVWISPYEVYDQDLQENVKICLVLIEKGPPKPDIWGVRVPTRAIENFPMHPVEW